MSDKSTQSNGSHGSGLTPKKMFFVVGLMLVAFLGAYNFALASNQSSLASGTAAPSLGGAAVASAGGGGCCSGGGAGGASAGSTSGNVASGSTSAGSAGGANPGGSVAPGGGGCCGGGGGPALTAKAKTSGGVQKIDVDTSKGIFNPNQIKVKAGVPVEITFSQSPGGCLSGVVFQDFGINQDLTGGPQTIKLPALKKGTYTFTCQMGMASGQIVAE